MSNEPKYLFGFHDPGGEFLMAEAGKKGWVLITEEIGRDPNNHNGNDYSYLADQGFGVIVRLNHGYGRAGTIPKPEYYDDFAKRCGNFVHASRGCHIWIIGNEMNHSQERPEGQPITPQQYAVCFRKCREQIRSRPGHEFDQVVIGAVAPWNIETTYPGNPSGDWIQYFVDLLRLLEGECDGIALHTYTHGSDPELVFSEQRMDPPYEDRHYHFRAYRDFMAVIPQSMRDLPVYITETDQDVPWENANRGWVRNAYQEIHNWNQTPGNQQIRCLLLYRWQNWDRWGISNKPGVIADFKEALKNEYTWKPTTVTPTVINGHIIHGPFLEFYKQYGQAICGLPISDEMLINGKRTQYFERLALEETSPGQVAPAAIGSQLLETRQRLLNLEAQIKALQAQIASQPTTIPSTTTPPTPTIPTPTIHNVSADLLRHATKRYTTRKRDEIQYLVFHHSAVPATVPLERIARYHVEERDWPGIGYHFYIDAEGTIYQTNPLETISYHAGPANPVGVGICVAGSFMTEIPTDAQIAAAAHLSAWLLQELNLDRTAIRGHKEFVNTQCPGDQWFEGKQWKQHLLAAVDAQIQQAQARARKPIYHYMLFYQYPDVWAEEDWLGAKEYIGRFRVTAGFSVDDAMNAEYVTIVGGPLGVSEEAEQRLRAAGCKVERIAGKNPEETKAILTEMARKGQRFLTLA